MAFLYHKELFNAKYDILLLNSIRNIYKMLRTHLMNKMYKIQYLFNSPANILVIIEPNYENYRAI